MTLQFLSDNGNLIFTFWFADKEQINAEISTTKLYRHHWYWNYMHDTILGMPQLCQNEIGQFSFNLACWFAIRYWYMFCVNQDINFHGYKNTLVSKITFKHMCHVFASKTGSIYRKVYIHILYVLKKNQFRSVQNFRYLVTRWRNYP